MLEILQIILPVISVLVSYWLGHIQQDRKFKRDQALARYNAFYVPFFTKLYAGRMWALRPSELGLEARSAFFDLLTNNLSCLGPALQSCYPPLHAAFCEMLNTEGNDRASAHFDAAFRRTVKAAIAESKALSKELHLPPISATYELCLRKERQRKPRRAPERPKQSST